MPPPGGFMDSQSVVKALHEVDPGFVALCDTLFGETVDPSDAWSFIYDGQISKAGPDMADMHVNTPMGKPAPRGVLVPKPPQVPTVAPVKKPATPAANGVPPIAKADDSLQVVWSGEFSKRDDEKRQAFGWASVVEINGEPVVDLQGDWVSPEEIEKAAYSYVLKSRVGGTQHQRNDDDSPVHAGTMIESFVVTPEKVSKMGLPHDFPLGWWVGYQYDDDGTWDDIKSGKKTGFSVHGRGKRTPVEI